MLVGALIMTFIVMWDWNLKIVWLSHWKILLWKSWLDPHYAIHHHYLFPTYHNKENNKRWVKTTNYFVSFEYWSFCVVFRRIPWRSSRSNTRSWMPPGGRQTQRIVWTPRWGLWSQHTSRLRDFVRAWNLNLWWLSHWKC